MATVLGSQNIQNLSVSGFVNVNQRLFNQAGGDWRFILDPADASPIKLPSEDSDAITMARTQSNTAGFKNYGVFVADPIMVPVGGEEQTESEQIANNYPLSNSSLDVTGGPSTTNGPVVPLEASTGCFQFEDLNPGMNLQPGSYATHIQLYDPNEVGGDPGAGPPPASWQGAVSTSQIGPVLYLPKQQNSGNSGSNLGAQPGIIQYSLDPQTQSAGVWSKTARASNVYFMNNTCRILQLFAPSPMDTEDPTLANTAAGTAPLPANFTRGSTLIIPPGQARMITLLPPSIVPSIPCFPGPSGRIDQGGGLLTGQQGQAPAEVTVFAQLTPAVGGNPAGGAANTGWGTLDEGRIIGVNPANVGPALPPYEYLVTVTIATVNAAGNVTGIILNGYDPSMPRPPFPESTNPMLLDTYMDGGNNSGTVPGAGVDQIIEIQLIFNDTTDPANPSAFVPDFPGQVAPGPGAPGGTPEVATNAYTQLAFLCPSLLPLSC